MERVSYAQEHLLRRIVEKRQAQFVHRHFGRSEDLLTKYMVLKGTSERLATTDSEWFQIERNQLRLRLYMNLLGVKRMAYISPYSE